MVYPPQQTLSIRNNGVGLVQNPDGLPLVVGYAKGLTPTELYQYSNPNTLKDEAQSGPVLETALAAIKRSGAVMVLAVAASVAATTSSVTASRVDSSTGDVEVSGTPVLEFDASVTITKTGAKGRGRFKFSLDGLTDSQELLIPLGGTYAMPGSDLTLTFVGTPSNGAVTQSGSGPAISLSGVGGGDDSYVLTISTGGTNGTAQFGLTRNGSSIASGVTVPTTPFTYAVPGSTSLVITFADSTWVLNETYSFATTTSVDADFEVGDVHSFTTTAPHYSTADLAAAFATLRSKLGARKVRKTVFTGRNTTTASGAAMFAAAASHLATLQASHYFGRGLIDAGVGTVDAFRSDWSAAASDLVGVTWRRARCIVDPVAAFPGYANAWQSGVRAVAERWFSVDLSENLGRKASGNLEYVTEIEHDEGVDQAFVEGDKVITLKTFTGETGFYITNGFLRSPAGSDFLYLDWGVTIDTMCHGIVSAQDKWLLAKLRALTNGSGNLDPNDAERVRGAVKGALRALLSDPVNVEGFKGHVSGFEYLIDLTNDFLATRTVRSTGAAVPLPPVEAFTTTVGLTRSI